MCTVTIVPRGDGFRLVCNRDERRDRVAALPPAVHSLSGIEATFPTDPQGGGTWIGVNSAGLAVTLLNRTDDDASRTRSVRAPRFSRGLIVPPLLGIHSLSSALSAARRVNAGGFAPFRLVLAQGTTCAVLSSNGGSLSISAYSFNTPLMFTSSSLGDELVAAPRRLLFEQLVLSRADADEWIQGQRRFHGHRWADRPHVSVLMSRADARTVSRTTIDVCSSFVTLAYESSLPTSGWGERVLAMGSAA